MLEQIMPNLYRITVALPGNPLRSLNSYVFLGEDRNLLVDTGFNRPECLEALQQGIAELGLDMERTDIFLTHLHADHTGLVCRVVRPGRTIYMSAADKELLNMTVQNPAVFWKTAENIFAAEGFPEEVLQQNREFNPARNFVADAIFPGVELAGGEMIEVGSWKLECILTPGHTPGHICLYDREHKLMVTGDHVLFDITPNITVWAVMPDSLKHYLESLARMEDYEVERTLTGHRENNGDFKTRLCQLQSHHQERLGEVRQIIRSNPGINGYQVAARMTWSIRANSWEDFPPAQKWFAVGEAVAHLNYLVDHHEILRTAAEGVHHYQCSAE